MNAGEDLAKDLLGDNSVSLGDGQCLATGRQLLAVTGGADCPPARLAAVSCYAVKSAA
jgi:hypothetical protein